MILMERDQHSSLFIDLFLCSGHMILIVHEQHSLPFMCIDRSPWESDRA